MSPDRENSIDKDILMREPFSMNNSSRNDQLSQHHESFGGDSDWLNGWHNRTTQAVNGFRKDSPRKTFDNQSQGAHPQESEEYTSSSNKFVN